MRIWGKKHNQYPYSQVRPVNDLTVPIHSKTWLDAKQSKEPPSYLAIYNMPTGDACRNLRLKHCPTVSKHKRYKNVQKLLFCEILLSEDPKK